MWCFHCWYHLTQIVILPGKKRTSLILLTGQLPTLLQDCPLHLPWGRKHGRRTILPLPPTEKQAPGQLGGGGRNLDPFVGRGWGWGLQLAVSGCQGPRAQKCHLGVDGLRAFCPETVQSMEQFEKWNKTLKIFTGKPYRHLLFFPVQGSFTRQSCTWKLYCCFSPLLCQLISTFLSCL